MKWKGEDLAQVDGLELAAADVELKLAFDRAWEQPPDDSRRLTRLFQAILEVGAEKARREQIIAGT